jgi:septal ring factor EnvC (AmiA/AmiB activator)
MRYVVLVQHGDYFTVYAKLREVYVKKGQLIATGDSIGTVNTDSNGVSELQFQVWRNNQKLNPAEWLASR